MPSLQTSGKLQDEVTLSARKDSAVSIDLHGKCEPQTHRTTRSEEKPLRRPVINAARLWKDIHDTAKWGAIPTTMGMCRLAASSTDGAVRDWFRQQALGLGCKIKVDEIGNIFAILEGSQRELAPIGMGSHLDTQAAGGRFDGILGVLAGLEVLRTIKENGIQTNHSLAAICWTNEEGAGFTSGCTGSSVWAGHQTLTHGLSLRETTGAAAGTLGSKLSDIGYLGQERASYATNPLSCHFELHIEQGRQLERINKRVGIVTGIQGIRWFRATVQGLQGHAGSMPMADRADALLAVAHVQIVLDKLARKYDAVATVGVIETGSQASSNTIPGWAQFTIDIRCRSEKGLDLVVDGAREEMKRLETQNTSLSFDLVEVWYSPAAVFDERMLSCLRNGATELAGRDTYTDLISYAGHDSALTALRVPTAMLFIPSRDGISHAPEEWSSYQQCADGAQTLLNAVLEYDHSEFSL